MRCAATTCRTASSAGHVHENGIWLDFCGDGVLCRTLCGGGDRPAPRRSMHGSDTLLLWIQQARRRTSSRPSGRGFSLQVAWTDIWCASPTPNPGCGSSFPGLACGSCTSAGAPSIPARGTCPTSRRDGVGASSWRGRPGRNPSVRLTPPRRQWKWWRAACLQAAVERLSAIVTTSLGWHRKTGEGVTTFPSDTPRRKARRRSPGRCRAPERGIQYALRALGLLGTY